MFSQCATTGRHDILTGWIAANRRAACPPNGKGPRWRRLQNYAPPARLWSV